MANEPYTDMTRPGIYHPKDGEPLVIKINPDFDHVAEVQNDQVDVVVKRDKDTTRVYFHPKR